MTQYLSSSFLCSRLMKCVVWDSFSAHSTYMDIFLLANSIRTTISWVGKTAYFKDMAGVISNIILSRTAQNRLELIQPADIALMNSLQ